MSPEKRAQVLAAFHGSETPPIVAKHLGVGRDRVYKIWKEEFGEAAIRDRGNKFRGLAKAATGNSADPKVREQAVAAFLTDEALKKVASRLGVHYTRVREWWIKAYGEAVFLARRRRLQQERTRETHIRLSGRKRNIRTTEFPCSRCTCPVKLSVMAAKRQRILCSSCDLFERNANTPCPVCGFLCNGKKGVATHFRHTMDDAHHQWQINLKLKKQNEILNGNHVVCRLCGHVARSLWNHLHKIHRMTPLQYLDRYPDAKWRTKEIARKQTYLSVMVRKSFGYSRGKRKIVVCTSCQTKFEMSLFVGSIHDLRCEACKRKAEDAQWSLLSEPQDYVTCKACGYRAESLVSHLQNTHPELSRGGYQQEYKSPVMAQKFVVSLRREDLTEFLRDGKVDLVKAQAKLKYSYPTLKKESLRLGLPIWSHRVSQTKCCDLISKIVGVPYISEWTDDRFTNPESGRKFKFDGYFESIGLVVEFHGYQHWTFPSIFFPYEDMRAEWEAMRTRDRLKQEAIEEVPGLAFLCIREDEPYQDADYLRLRLKNIGIS